MEEEAYDFSFFLGGMVNFEKQRFQSITTTTSKPNNVIKNPLQASQNMMNFQISQCPQQINSLLSTQIQQ